ncbi:retention module-containing protein, partial [Polaromonas sp.]|uniref:retention module-containing protein n=2 Tax=Polaromonas sp. TaxID=1869339 RepID=UPI00272F3E8D
MAKEANVVGNVVLIEGIAFAQNSDGEQRPLKFGDPVFEGEVIVTAAGGRVELAFDQGGKFLLRSSETVTLDSTVFGNVLPDANSGALLPRVGELTSILNAINEGSSLDRLLQETSSGVNSASDVGGTNIRADDGNNFVQLLRTAEGLAPLTYDYASLDRQALGYLPSGGVQSLYEASASVNNYANIAGVFPLGPAPVAAKDTAMAATTVTLSSTTAGTAISEGGSITYTATVGAPVTGSALVISLSNGESIT